MREGWAEFYEKWGDLMGAWADLFQRWARQSYKKSANLYADEIAEIAEVFGDHPGFHRPAIGFDPARDGIAEWVFGTPPDGTFDNGSFDDGVTISRVMDDLLAGAEEHTKAEKTPLLRFDDILKPVVVWPELDLGKDLHEDVVPSEGQEARDQETS